MKASDLVGRVFGRLQVIARAGITDRTPRRPHAHDQVGEPGASHAQ
jgi:hypothetical protein